MLAGNIAKLPALAERRSPKAGSETRHPVLALPSSVGSLAMLLATRRGASIVSTVRNNSLSVGLSFAVVLARLRSPAVPANAQGGFESLEARLSPAVGLLVIRRLFLDQR